MKKLFIAMLTALVFSPVFSQNGYEIKVKILGVKDTTLILGHHFAKSMYPDDTIRVDKNGNGVFKDKKPLPQGLYIIFLPSKTYFDIVVGEDQFFTVENDTSDLFKKLKFTGSKENQVFFDYQLFLSNKRDEVKKLQDEKKNAKPDDGKDINAEKFKALDLEVKAYRNKTIAENQGSFVAKFIQATQELDVPDAPKDDKGNIIDSTYQYRYYRSHYFDNFDVADGRLLRTPLYEEKILTYIDKVVPQAPDSIIPEVDMLIAKSRSSTELFRYMLVTLFNHYGQSQIMGFDAVALTIADKYYIKEATWSDSAFIKKLKKQVVEKMPLLIGKQAPNIELIQIPTEHFLNAAEDTAEKRNVYVGSLFNLYQFKKAYTILYFWDVDCGHCKKETPIMYDTYKKLQDKNVQLIAVSLVFSRENKEKWVNYINEHQMYDWVNAFYPYSVKFKELYDVTSTPTIYILDSTMKIIAKRIGAAQCEEIINHEIEMAARKK